MSTSEAIRKAVKEAGGQEAVARLTGRTQPAVSAWIKSGSVPPPVALDLEEASGGKVSIHELHPEAYPRGRVRSLYRKRAR